MTVKDNEGSALVVKSSGTNAAFFTLDTSDGAEKVKLTGASSGTNVFHVDVGTALFDESITVSGEVQTATISFTDGDNAMTIADTGLVTFPQIVTMSSTLTIAGASTTVGGDSRFEFVRPSHSTNAGTATSIVGQTAGGNGKKGGDVELKGGAGSSLSLIHI